MRIELGERGLQFDDTRRTAVFEQQGKKYEARNPSSKRLLGYQVEEGILANSTKKTCDYLLGLPQLRHVYLIELKGHHLREAAKQLTVTMNQLGAKLDGKGVSARVVLSRVPRPDIRSADVLQLARRLAKLGGDLIYRSVQFSEEVGVS